MPLKESASKKAFGENVKAEENAGKPQKQAVAIAYSEKAKAEGVKHAADGAVVEDHPGLDTMLGLTGGGPSFDQQSAADAANARAALSVEGETPGEFMIRRGDGASTKIPKTGLSPAVQAALRQSLVSGGQPLPAGALQGVAFQEPQQPATPPAGASTPADDAADAEAGAEEASAEESAKAAGVAPMDLSGLEGAEKRVESANNSAADLSSLDAPLAERDAALTHEQDVTQKEGAAEAGVSSELAGKLSDLDQQSKDREAAFEKDWAPKFDAFQKSSINPNQLWQKMGFGGKVLATVGRVLGAFAAGYGKVPDEANAIINNAVEQNIQAQRNNVALQGQALEFQRQHNMDQNQFEALSRLSMREDYAAKLQAVQAKGLSDEKSAAIDSLKANNDVAVAQLKHQLASTAGQQNAAANYGLEASKVQLAGAAAAGAAGKPAKPEDLDKLSKVTTGMQALDNLSTQIGQGWQASIPWLAPLVRAASHVPASDTQNALAERQKVAAQIYYGLNPDMSRQPSDEGIKQIADMLPSPLKTEGQNARDYTQLRQLLVTQGKAHYFAAYGQMPADTNTYLSAPSVGAPSSHVRLLNQKGERVLMPAPIAQKAIASGLYKPAP